MYRDQDYKYDHTFKIVFVGDTSVGKTSIITSFRDKIFNEHAESTKGIDFIIKTTKLNNKDVKLLLWDTAGQERFRAITIPYYRYTNGVILVYDVSNKESFDNLKKWSAEIDKYCNETTSKLIIGNKSDLKRVISFNDGKNLANHLNYMFTETSTKTSIGVEEAFNLLINDMIKNNNYDEMTPIITKINQENNNYNEDECAC